MTNLGNISSEEAAWLIRFTIQAGLENGAPANNSHITAEYVTEQINILRKSSRNTETLERWNDYKRSGESVDNDRVMEYLDTWTTDEITESNIKSLIDVVKRIARLYSGEAIENDSTEVKISGHDVYLAQKAINQILR